jgi:hypothetical protein
MRTHRISVRKSGRRAGGVAGGELDSVEEGGGAFGFEVAGGEGVDDDGECSLDGLAVFERGEFDVRTRKWAAGGGVVALVGTLVEVAVASRLEGRGFAAAAVGLGVAAEWKLHLVFSLGGTPLPHILGASLMDAIR